MMCSGEGATTMQNGLIDETRACNAFSALGHPVRLQLYRLLIRANPKGARVSDIGAHLGINGATLTHHLSTLVQAGLVTQQRTGREIINRADMGTMQQISDFMVAQCCAGLEGTDQPPLPASGNDIETGTASDQAA
jgi:ArsR family transcriptional regulator